MPLQNQPLPFKEELEPRPITGAEQSRLLIIPNALDRLKFALRYLPEESPAEAVVLRPDLGTTTVTPQTTTQSQEQVPSASTSAPVVELSAAQRAVQQALSEAA